jgi:hypothetical protein
MDRSSVAPAAGAGPPAEVAWYLIEDHDRIAERMNDVVVHRIFAAGLNLHVALGLLRDRRGAREIHQAIDDLDQAIRDIRDCIFDDGRPGPGERVAADPGDRVVRPAPRVLRGRPAWPDPGPVWLLSAR